MQLGFELEIYEVDELAGMYWYGIPPALHRNPMFHRPNRILGPRYLQHLANTRLQHLERIRLFTARAFGRISKPSPKQTLSFDRSFSFLDLAMLEASAIQTFADGLSCVSVFIGLARLLELHTCRKGS